MRSYRFHTASAAALVLLAIESGCTTRLGGSANPPSAAAAATVNEKKMTLPQIESASESQLAGVLDKLQQVRELDPAAEQKLIEVLRQTPTDSWPLVAEQFRASLAYHEQLVAKREGSTAAAELDLKRDERPSAAIGALPDPRKAEAKLADIEPSPQEMHAAMQAPIEALNRPEEFVAERAALPIPVQHAPQSVADSASSTNVKTTAYEAPATISVPEELKNVPQSNGVVDWQEHLERALTELDGTLAASPSTTGEVHQHVSLRIMQLLAGDTESALRPIPNISPVEQDYWSKQLFALATYLDHHGQPDEKRRAAASVIHLDEAVSHLRELGSLSLRNLAFCKDVYGYGSIEPYESDQFSTGEKVSLYVEVENYHSHSTENGYCTLLGSTYEILDGTGKRVEGGEFPNVDDCCRSRRRDFHMQYGLTLPAGLAAGEYRIQLVVKDRQSDKIGSASIPFKIRGKLP